MYLGYDLVWRIITETWIQDVHETAAGALWNLAFNPGNALRIVEEEGVPALVHLCSSSRSKMARFMAALALAYMFDSRYLVLLTLYGDHSLLCEVGEFVVCICEVQPSRTMLSQNAI